MKILPRLPHEFILWWLLAFPRRLLRICSRILALLNSQMAFTLNFKLLFTPLFGDYTVVGRLIGFMIRIFWILGGLVFFVVMLVICSSLILAWYAFPIGILKYEGLLYLLLYIFTMYLFFIIRHRNTPRLRTTKNIKEDYKLSCRNEVLYILDLIKNDQSIGLKYLFDTREGRIILTRSEINNELLYDKLRSSPQIQTDALGQAAFMDALRFKSKYVELEHLFVAVLNNIPKIDIILSSMNTSLKNINGAVEWESNKRNIRDRLFIWQDDYELIFTGGFGKGMLGRVTPRLDSVSHDLTTEVLKNKYQKILGRESEIKTIAEILSGTKENVLIIGEPGCGKTTLVRGVAQKIMEGNEYRSISNKRLVGLDIGGLISGAKNSGMIAENLNMIMNDVKSSGDIILFIDEIHNLVADADDTNAETSKIYSILEPHLSEDKVQFIGATSMPNYRKYIEPNGAFSRLFHIVEIQEPSKETTVKILETKADNIEEKQRIIITYPALVKTVELSEKLMHERVLPDKAIDILTRTATHFEGKTKILNSEAIAEEISQMTHIPKEVVSQDEAQKLLSIEDEMKKMIVGQDEAVRQISTALRRGRAGIRDDKRPIASFLFVGTTGVGKTQTAKALAQHYFGNVKNMIRLDMSEYQQIDSINRLLGSPEGTSKGMLSDLVRSKPFSLLLLDEVEKAHPNILLAFLQVLDEGTLTDNTGIKLDFTNTIIIATSNVGTKSIQQVFAEHGTLDKMRERAMSDVREKFAPEFLNRFTGIIVFNPLSGDNIRDITKILLDRVRESTRAKNIDIRFSQDLVNALAEKGYSEEWGARPLARLIEDTVETHIATKILKKELNPGDQILLGTEVMNS